MEILVEEFPSLRDVAEFDGKKGKSCRKVKSQNVVSTYFVISNDLIVINLFYSEQLPYTNGFRSW